MEEREDPGALPGGTEPESGPGSALPSGLPKSAKTPGEAGSSGGTGVSHPPGDDAVETAVEAYLVALDEPTPPTLDSYCEEHPPELRGAIREACVGALEAQRLLESTAPAPVTSGLAVGSTLGDYTLVTELGRGGMGVVYLARQRGLERDVALKVLLAHLTLSDRQVQRFRREALAAAKLMHPGIAQLFSVGEEADTHYFAMEYVTGGSLKDRLDGRRRRHSLTTHGSTRGPQASHGLEAKPRSQPEDDDLAAWIESIVTIAADVADALHYAHGRGVIHRDVKPENILLDEGERPKLCDFGLAKDSDVESLSSAGDVSGTPFYMSPEQALAKRVPVDARTDIFSLGVVLYEMLSLRRPFEGGTVQAVLFQISFREPTPLRKIEARMPRDLDVIVGKCIAKNPDERFTDASQLAADLRRFLGREAILARPPSLAQRTSRLAKRYRAPLLVGVIVALALALGAFALDRKRSGDAIESRVAAVAIPVEEGTLEGRPLSEILDLATEHRALLEIREQLTEEQRGRIDGVEGALALLSSDWEDLGHELRDHASTVGSEAEFAESSTLFMRAYLLDPTRDDLLELADMSSLRPTVSIHSDRGGDSVTALRLDPRTEQVEMRFDLGTTPLDRVPLEPGLWRVQVRRQGFGRVEMTRHLDRALKHVELSTSLRSDAEVEAGMVSIPGGYFRFGIPGQTNPHFAEREEWLDGFLIDPHEVSNGDFRLFLESQGLPALPHWPEPWDPAWDALPVVGVSHGDATRYAEWRGKRLPTQREWERACRGTDGRRRPWIEEGIDISERAVVGIPNASELETVESPGAYFERYVKATRPVDSMDLGRGPHGLYHTLGNVSEWTESLFHRPTPEGISLAVGHRIHKGPAWNSPPQKWDLDGLSGELAEVRLNTLGFRCARSLDNQ